MVAVLWEECIQCDELQEVISYQNHIHVFNAKFKFEKIITHV